MNKDKNTLVFIYNSFNDPLVQNLVLTYLKTLSTKTKGDFHIITFEQLRYHLKDQEKHEVKKELKKSRMHWHPMVFHTGRFLLLKKAWDFNRAFLRVLYVRFRFRTKYIFAFANVSASFSIFFARLLRMKMIVYSYEPHSDFLADLRLWKRSGLKYRLLNRLEWYAGRHADYVLTGTKYMVERLKQEGSRAKLFRAPTAVDELDFYFREEGRKRIRKMLHIGDKKVFLYLGKFGDLYYTDEIPQMLGAVLKLIPKSFFLIVTSNDHSQISQMFSNYLPDGAYHITGYLPFEEVKHYISAADIGISGVPPSPSQKYRSPTKVAEYLLCGLPYITTAGVSEDDLWAIKENVGVVIGRFSADEISKEITVLERLLEEDKNLQRKRCREVGLRYRSKEHIDRILEEIYFGHEH